MQATVRTDTGQQVEYQSNTEKLTPKTAVAIRDAAFGVRANATVSAGGSTYRVTGKNNVRKVNTEW